MSNQKHKKIFYVPGIISAILLPVAFYFFAKREMEKSLVTAIPFDYFDTIRLKNFGVNFLPGRNYTTVVLNGNVHDDQIKLEFYQIRMREILSQNDTLEGLHFAFENNSHYGSFVALLDKLRIEDARYYFAIDDGLWFFDEHERLDTAQPILPFSCGFSDDVLQPEISWWAETKERLNRVWVSSRQLVLLFCSFIAAVLLLKRKNKGDRK